MPLPWTGLRAMAGAGSYAETFLQPEAGWPEEEVPSEFLRDDLLWWRPSPRTVLPRDTLVFGFHMGSMYHMWCERCDTKWMAEANSIPKCWFCGRFVPLNKNFKEERQKLRAEWESDA